MASNANEYANENANVFCSVTELLLPPSSSNSSRRQSSEHAHEELLAEELLAEELLFLHNPTYTIKQLHQLFDYYGLCKYKVNKEKFSKDELLKQLYYYEHNADNLARVQQRHYMWNCLLALKQDPYFSKYILYNF
jgi:hypothetical protein